MAIPLLSDLFRWLTTRRREQTLDLRASEKSLADELEHLATLLDDVLKATGPDDRVMPENARDLLYRCRRAWNRWCTIVESRGFVARDKQMQSDLERCIEIVHAAPGAYVQEIYLLQVSLADETVPPEIRIRFAESIDRLRNLAVRLRLSH